MADFQLITNQPIRLTDSLVAVDPTAVNVDDAGAARRSPVEDVLALGGTPTGVELLVDTTSELPASASNWQRIPLGTTPETYLTLPVITDNQVWIVAWIDNGSNDSGFAVISTAGLLNVTGPGSDWSSTFPSTSEGTIIGSGGTYTRYLSHTPSRELIWGSNNAGWDPRFLVFKLNLGGAAGPRGPGGADGSSEIVGATPPETISKDGTATITVDISATDGSEAPLIPLDTITDGAILASVDQTAESVFHAAGSFLLRGRFQDLDTGGAQNRGAPGLRIEVQDPSDDSWTTLEESFYSTYLRNADGSEAIDVMAVYYLPVASRVRFRAFSPVIFGVGTSVVPQDWDFDGFEAKIWRVGARDSDSLLSLQRQVEHLREHVDALDHEIEYSGWADATAADQDALYGFQWSSTKGTFNANNWGRELEAIANQTDYLAVRVPAGTDIDRVRVRVDTAGVNTLHPATGESWKAVDVTNGHAHADFYELVTTSSDDGKAITVVSGATVYLQLGDASVTSGDSGSPSLAVFSGYHFHRRPALTAPNISSNTNIAASGAPFSHSLLPETEILGGIEANRDFVTEYEGFIYIDLASAANVNADLVVTHSYARSGSLVSFESHRRFLFRLGSNTQTTIPMATFNSRTRIPTGTFNTRDGTEITVDQALLNEPVDISIQLRLTTENTSGTRVARTLSSLTGQNLQVTMYQLGGEVETVETEDPRVEWVFRSLTDLRRLTDNVEIEREAARGKWIAAPVAAGAAFAFATSEPADAAAAAGLSYAAGPRTIPDGNQGPFWFGRVVLRVNSGADISTWRLVESETDDGHLVIHTIVSRAHLASLGTSGAHDYYVTIEQGWYPYTDIYVQAKTADIDALWTGDLLPEKVRAVLPQASPGILPQGAGAQMQHHAAWGGGFDPSDTTSPWHGHGVVYESISTETTGLGYASTGGRILIGRSDNRRGQMRWRDINGVADPQRCVLQAAVSGGIWGARGDIVFGIGTNNPAQPAIAGWRGWDLFDRGVMLVFSPTDMAIYMMSCGDGIDPSVSAAWRNWVALSDAGSWQVVDSSAVSATRSATDAVVNATLTIQSGVSWGGLLAYHGISIQNFDRETQIYYDGVHWATWTWTPARAPFRSARPDAGPFFLVRSTAGTNVDIDGVSYSSHTYCRGFAISPAERRAPVRDIFI